MGFGVCIQRWALMLIAIVTWRTAEAQSIVISIPDTTIDAGETIWLPVRVAEIVAQDSVIAFQMLIDYPEDIMSFSGMVRKGPLISEERTILDTVMDNGTIRIVSVDYSAIVGAGTLFSMECTVLNNVADGTHRPIKIGPLPLSTPYLFNEGWTSYPRPDAGWPGIPMRPVTIDNGTILVSNPNVTSVLAAQTTDASPSAREGELAASPNPFNAHVRLRLTAHGGRAWHGVIANTAGQVVRHWDMRSEHGDVEWKWDGLNDHGRPVSSGVYVASASDGRDRVWTRVSLVR